MANRDSKMLIEAIHGYLDWIKSVDEHRGKPTSLGYRQTLFDFLTFTIIKDITWEEMFTINTLEAFCNYSDFKGARKAVVNLSQYLFISGKIDQPIKILIKPRALKTPLPDIYEQYLLYQEQGKQASSSHLRQMRRILTAFNTYLEQQDISLPSLKIEHLDAFMTSFSVKNNTRSLYRSFLRGFVRYLYYQKGVIKRDLASLLVGPRLLEQQKPPKFLRPEEVKRLFSNPKLSTPADIRTYAMVHLAYSLGLRPSEISRITFDDISFSEGQISIPIRKSDNPITLPIPEITLKAVAAYVLKARPKSNDRHIFLKHYFPYEPIRANLVTQSLSKAMKHAGLASSGYWLRHTYAQNLLHIGHSIQEIKEMLGHDSIESSRKYMYIHTELMRKVLFNETL
jgi:site-specific recombinase XerD